MTFSYMTPTRPTIDSELATLKRNLQMKRAMGYGLTQRDIAHLDYLTSKQQEMKRMQQRAAEKRKREALASFPKQLTVEDVVEIFRMFDSNHDDVLSGADFCSLVSALLSLRQGEQPTEKKALMVAKMLAQNMVYQQRYGGQVDGISLNDFVYNSVHGQIGKFISETHRVSKDLKSQLRAYCQLKQHCMSNSDTTEPSSDLDSSDEDWHECVNNASEEASMSSPLKEEDISVVENQEVEPNLESESEEDSDDENSEEEEEDDSDDEDEKIVQVPQKNLNELAHDEGDVDDDEEEEEEEANTNQHTFAKGELLLYRRPEDDSCRTVKVVELLDSENYVVEHEVETTANHIALPDGVEGPIVKGSEVLYKNKNKARVIEVGSAYTFDEEGRPSYLIAVKTYTDSSRLSRENQ